MTAQKHANQKEKRTNEYRTPKQKCNRKVAKHSLAIFR
jgi:hypothetical protein